IMRATRRAPARIQGPNTTIPISLLDSWRGVVPTPVTPARRPISGRAVAPAPAPPLAFGWIPWGLASGSRGYPGLGAANPRGNGVRSLSAVARRVLDRFLAGSRGRLRRFGCGVWPLLRPARGLLGHIRGVEDPGQRRWEYRWRPPKRPRQARPRPRRNRTVIAGPTHSRTAPRNPATPTHRRSTRSRVVPGPKPRPRYADVRSRRRPRAAPRLHRSITVGGTPHHAAVRAREPWATISVRGPTIAGPADDPRTGKARRSTKRGGSTGAYRSPKR